jgi:hypothetical protein
VLNVFNLIKWRFDLLIPAESGQSGAFVNPRMATLTLGVQSRGKETLAKTKDSNPSGHILAILPNPAKKVRRTAGHSG